MKLYKSIKIRELELPNRWVMSPMCMYSANGGVANDFHFAHYLNRAQGGVGLIMVEATGVLPEGRITPNCLGLWNDDQMHSLKRIVNYIKEHTATKMGVQLNHSGRKGSTHSGKQIGAAEGGWHPKGPSALPFQPDDLIPQVLSIDEIELITNAFAAAAGRAVDAGFDTVEIHAAHGYLLHEFLSPVSNNRDDLYGGSFENRSRLLLEVVDAVRAVIPEEMPLFVRISATEYAEKGQGWDIDESAQLAVILKDRGVDAIDVSSGGNIYNAKTTPYSVFHNKLSDRIKKESGILTGTVGLIDSAAKAEEILQSGDADLIFVGRALLRNPFLPVLESFAADQECFFPAQYHRGKSDV